MNNLKSGLKCEDIILNYGSLLTSGNIHYLKKYNTENFCGKVKQID